MQMGRFSIQIFVCRLSFLALGGGDFVADIGLHTLLWVHLRNTEASNGHKNFVSSIWLLHSEWAQRSARPYYYDHIRRHSIIESNDGKLSMQHCWCLANASPYLRPPASHPMDEREYVATQRYINGKWEMNWIEKTVVKHFNVKC